MAPPELGIGESTARLSCIALGIARALLWRILFVEMPADRMDDLAAVCSDAENLALSVSVQLSPETAYMGARLQFEGPSGPFNATSVQGAAIFFSPAILHRVEPIVAGASRLAVVAWFRLRDDLFWGHDALLSDDPCVAVFPLLAAEIPASFSKLPSPSDREVLVSATRRTSFFETEASAATELAASLDRSDPVVEFVEIDLPPRLGPPRQLCVVSPWPPGVAVCATTDDQEDPDQPYRLLMSSAGVLELVASAQRYQLRPCP